MSNEEKQNDNFLVTKTWIRDSHGLFDYENDHLFSRKFRLNSSGYLTRKKGDVNFYQDEKQDEQTLAQVDLNNMTIKSTRIQFNLPINNQTLIDLQEQVWYVVKQSDDVQDGIMRRFYSNYEYELKENDIIKLGRIKFVVKKLSIVGHEIKTTKETFSNYENSEEKTNTKDESPEEEKICHVCYSSEISDDNPMLSICKCKGSMHTHLNCLKMWLNSRKTVQEIVGKMGVSYTIKKFNCEICNEPFPVTVKNKDKFFNLIDYEEPIGQNYIILQSLNSVKENSYPLSVHVLMFLENEGFFILGRGHESDLRISDISVSRQHAKIFMKNNKFYMEDLKSKFGTLVLAKEEVKLNTGNLYQIGRTLVYYGPDKNYIYNSNIHQLTCEFGLIAGFNGFNNNDDEDYNN